VVKNAKESKSMIIFENIKGIRRLQKRKWARKKILKKIEFVVFL